MFDRKRKFKKISIIYLSNIDFLKGNKYKIKFSNENNNIKKVYSH